jgi:hypothetical protein
MYKAYCITPSFFSWLGNGTSRFTLPVTLNGDEPWFPDKLEVIGTLAGFCAEDEIAATDRYGIREEAGLTGN